MEFDCSCASHQDQLDGVARCVERVDSADHSAIGRVGDVDDRVGQASVASLARGERVEETARPRGFRSATRNRTGPERDGGGRKGAEPETEGVATGGEGFEAAGEACASCSRVRALGRRPRWQQGRQRPLRATCEVPQSPFPLDGICWKARMHPGSRENIRSPALICIGQVLPAWL